VTKFLNGQIFDSFSTRELAIAIWISVALIYSIFNKSNRQSLFGVFKAFLAWKISVSILAFFTHTILCVLIIYKIGFWNISLLKDTIILTLSFGMISLMSINKINDKKYFKNMFIEAIKWTIVLEYIVNFFTFSLAKELILVPVLFFFAMTQTAVSFDKKHKQVGVLLKNLHMYFSIFIFLYSLYKTVENYNELFTANNLKVFLLPIFLTILFLPFIYMYNLVVKYELLWIKLKFIIRNEDVRKKVKLKILLVANFNFNKLVNISQNIAKPIILYNDYFKNMIIQVSKGKYIGFDE